MKWPGGSGGSGSGGGGGLAAASNAQTITGVLTNRAVTPAGLEYERPYFDVRTYGAVGDGATDDTVAIQAAIDAATAADFGTVIIPPATFLFSTLIIPAAIRLQGCGTKLAIQLTFGTSSNWFDRTWIGGSVLQSTATAGKAITVDTPGADRQTHNLCIADVMIIGPGTGSAIGLSVGHPDQGTAAIRTRIDRVTVGNFDTGAYLGLENSTVDSLCIMGCNTGILTGNAYNGNTHTAIDVEKCTNFGLQLVDAASNTFTGGVFQGNTGTVIQLDDAHGCSFYGIYFENSTATRDFDIQNDALYNTIESGHFVAGSEILITGDGNRIINPQSSAGITITVDGQNNYLQGHFPIAPTLNAGATGTILIDTSNDLMRLREVAVQIEGVLDHDGTTAGFYATTPVTRPTSVTPKDALEALGLGVTLFDVDANPDMLAAGEFVPTERRDAFAATNVATLPTQALRLHYFTAQRTESITQIKSFVGGTAAAATPTLCRLGIYEIAANGDGTLIASTANDTALWAATNTAYTKSFSATFSKVRNQRYAIALLCVSAAATPVMCSPSAGGIALADTELAVAPRVSGTIASQTDLPSTFTSASVGVSRTVPTIRLIP